VSVFRGETLVFDIQATLAADHAGSAV